MGCWEDAFPQPRTWGCDVMPVLTYTGACTYICLYRPARPPFCVTSCLYCLHLYCTLYCTLYLHMPVPCTRQPP